MVKGSDGRVASIGALFCFVGFGLMEVDYEEDEEVGKRCHCAPQKVQS